MNVVADIAEVFSNTRVRLVGVALWAYTGGISVTINVGFVISTN